MEITIIVLALVLIGLLIYSAIKLNTYSVEKYDYQPINFLNILLMAIPFGLLFFGFLIFKDETNQFLSILFSFFIITGNLYYIQSKTDHFVAFASIFILMFAGFLVCLLIFGNSRNNNDDCYR